MSFYVLLTLQTIKSRYNQAHHVHHSVVLIYSSLAGWLCLIIWEPLMNRCLVFPIWLTAAWFWPPGLLCFALPLTLASEFWTMTVTLFLHACFCPLQNTWIRLIASAFMALTLAWFPGWWCEVFLIFIRCRAVAAVSGSRIPLHRGMQSTSFSCHIPWIKPFLK